MSTTKVCGNGGGTEHYRATVFASGEKGGTLPIGALHAPRYENIICGNCGLTQWFVSREHLPLVCEKLECVSK